MAKYQQNGVTIKIHLMEHLRSLQTAGVKGAKEVYAELKAASTNGYCGTSLLDNFYAKCTTVGGNIEDSFHVIYNPDKDAISNNANDIVIGYLGKELTNGGLVDNLGFAASNYGVTKGGCCQACLGLVSSVTKKLKKGSTLAANRNKILTVLQHTSGKLNPNVKAICNQWVKCQH